MSLRLSGGRKLQSPSGQTARPTPAKVRLALMNILAAELRGCRWLDLCSGSGAMACEALQRGAAAVVAVEQDRRHAAVVRANLEAVRGGLTAQPAEVKVKVEVEVHTSEVGHWLRRPGQAGFDLIYADPPYAADLYAVIAGGVARGPWLKPTGTLVLECSSAAVPAIASLPGGWQLRDQRRYGTTSLLLLQQPISCRASSHAGTGSRPPQTGPSGSPG